MNRDELLSINARFERKKEDYTIWVVANIANTVQSYEDFVKHTSFSEFFTKAEFASIISAITEIYGYVRIFYSEIEFIDYLMSNKKSLIIKNLLVYNFARDGAYEGKKSLIPSLCDLFNIRYIGSNPFVISLVRNKFIYTQFLNAMGVPVPRTAIYRYGKAINFNIFNISDSLIIKNIFESASIGMSEDNIIRTWNKEDIISQLNKQCLNLEKKEILIQEYIEGIECEVFVIKYQNEYHAFQPIEILLNASDIITSTISDSYEYSFAPLFDRCSADICNKIMLTTEKAAELLNIGYYARIDYRINSSEQFFIIDIAGSPFLTRHSSISFLFTRLLNLKYSDIFLFLAAIVASDHPQEVNCKSDNGNPLEL